MAMTEPKQANTGRLNLQPLVQFLLERHPVWSERRLFRMTKEPQYAGLLKKIGRRSFVDVTIANSIERSYPPPKQAQHHQAQLELDLAAPVSAPIGLNLK